MRLLSLLLLPLVLLLAACGKPEQPARPAIWRVDRAGAPGENVAAGWLFGTIHALPSGTRWHGERLDDALDHAGVLVVEIADLDQARARQVFRSLAIDDALPPLAQRISPAYRDELAEVLDEVGAKPETFRNLETWAAALTLATMLQDRSALDPGNGVDRVLLADWRGRPVLGLETTEEQLGIFDRLPLDEQRALLEALVTQADEIEPDALSDAWRKGKAEQLARLMDMGFSQSPPLRNALLTRRNARWIDRIETALQAGRRPFVAVGAGHIEGDDGLIALLRARGWTVTRIQ